MNEYRLFVVSSPVFGGFSQYYNVFEYENTVNICEDIKNKINKILKRENFPILREILSKTKFHIHDFDIENIRKSIDDDIFYICDHCA